MKRIDFKEPDTDAWRDWKRRAKEAQEQLLANWVPGEPVEIDPALYGEMRHEYVRIFGGKCAFCESKITDVAHPHIEHFRPKKRIDDRDTGKPIRVKVGDLEFNHPGYFWLAYDFTNLLLSCPRCNVSGKKNYFPLVAGANAMPGDETDGEEPLLINPAKENPEDHFGVNFKLGELTPKTEKAAQSIEIFDLNREAVADQRRRQIFEVEKAYCEVRGAPHRASEEAMNLYKSYFDGTAEHSFFSKSRIECLLREAEDKHNSLVNPASDSSVSATKP